MLFGAVGTLISCTIISLGMFINFLFTVNSILCTTVGLYEGWVILEEFVDYFLCLISPVSSVVQHSSKYLDLIAFYLLYVVSGCLSHFFNMQMLTL